MKKLIVTLKTSDQVLEDFKSAFKRAKSKTLSDHFEISFDNKTDFNRFIRNIDILTFIIHHQPKSVYELAKLIDKDVSNLHKTIIFYEKLGVIRLERKKSGRESNQPIVKFDRIEFDLAA